VCGTPEDAGLGRMRDDGHECWVLMSTESFAKQLLTNMPLSIDGTYNPQTPEALQAIASTMFLAFTKLVEPFVGDACADPTFLFCQRWGHAYAATPLCLRDKCEVDGSHQFAMCGDFCHNGGVEGAALSALAAARLLQTVL